MDTTDSFENWRKRNKLTKIVFYVPDYIYSFLVSILLFSTIIILFKVLLKKVIIFEEGKEYQAVDEEKKTIKKKKTITIKYKTVKSINEKYNNEDISFRLKKGYRNIEEVITQISYYDKYFVDEIKQYRKLKLDKIKKIEI